MQRKTTLPIRWMKEIKSAIQDINAKLSHLKLCVKYIPFLPLKTNTLKCTFIEITWRSWEWSLMGDNQNWNTTVKLYFEDDSLGIRFSHYERICSHRDTRWRSGVAEQRMKWRCTRKGNERFKEDHVGESVGVRYKVANTKGWISIANLPSRNQKVDTFHAV